MTTSTTNIGLVALSFIIAAIAYFTALELSGRMSKSSGSKTMYWLIGGGLSIGFVIWAAHFVGMLAFNMVAPNLYGVTVTVLTLSVAIIASTFAVRLAALESVSSSRIRVCGLLLGAGIAIVHYLGTVAAVTEPAKQAYLLQGTAGDPLMGLQLAIAALVVLGFVLLTIAFDKRVAAERTRSNDAQKQATQLSALLDESLNEIFVIDIPTLRIVNVNRGACEHLGYGRDQLKSMTPIDITPGLTEDRICDRLISLAESEDDIVIYESVHRRSDGSTYPVEINLQLSNILGRPVALAIVSDITRRRTLEDQLVRAQKMELIGQLAAGIAHEINTPAQYVGDNTRFLKEAMSDVLELISAFKRLYAANLDFSVTPELLLESRELISAVDSDYLAAEIPAAIEQSLDGISRISSIVLAMKEFSHPGGKSQEPVDINRTIQNTITVACNEWKYVAEIETDFDQDLPVVNCMPQEISQVVLNLIVNAAHAISDTLEPGADAKGTISIQTRRVGDSTEIRISDTGGGIPDDIREHVFDAFFTTKDVGKGTGQGLTMAYRSIVKGHNGDLSFETIPGEGTTFVISLPLQVDLEMPMEVVA